MIHNLVKSKGTVGNHKVVIEDWAETAPEDWREKPNSVEIDGTYYIRMQDANEHCTELHEGD